MKMILIFLAMSFTASAHIYDTMQQCLDRYGVPESTAHDLLIFKKNGFNIACMIHDGKCVSILYTKEPVAGRRGAALTIEEIDTLKNANWPSEKYAHTSEGMNEKWISEDRKACVLYNTMNHTLSIVTPESMELFRAQKELKNSQQTQGL